MSPNEPESPPLKAAAFLADNTRTMPKTTQNPTGTAAHWLNRKRLFAYSGTILLSSFIFLLRSGAASWKSSGLPNGLDFTTFWAASRLWLDGHPLDAYSFDALTRAAHHISPNLPAPGPFFYPPNFLLLLRPLALLPGPASYIAFALGTAGVYAFLLRKILPMRDALLPILAFPGIWLTLAQGQNANITASLALGALVLLPRRPVLAGVCIGMLSIKPHLAILFPLALACAGMWTAFASAAVTTVLFTGIALAVFGLDIVPPFLHGMQFANQSIGAGTLPWTQTASLFATLRLAHLPMTPAYVAQACQALVAACAVAWVWRRSGDMAVRAMTLVAGTFMISPYIFNYDASWLAVPIALYTAKCLRDGWLRGEREILLAAWLYPAIGDFSGILLHVGVGPLIFWAMLFVAVRRVRVESNAGAQRPGVTPGALSAG
jgi:alpha-1,2-mannosyltransferase